MAPVSLPRLSLRVNASWTLAGNIIYAACQWGMVVVLARLGAPELLGQFALGLAISTPVLMLTNLQLRALHSTDARHEYQPGDYLALRLAMTTLALLLIAGVVIFAGYPQATAFVILAVALAKAVEALSDVCYGAFQQHERLDRVARSMILRGGLGLLALGAGVALTGEVLWGALALALAWAGVLLAYDLPRNRALAAAHGAGRLRPRWHGPTLLRLARLALPLGVVMMLVALNTNIPRYIVEQALGTSALGIFAAIAALERIGTTFVSALGQAASPRLARAYAAGNETAYRALVLKLVAGGGALGIVGVLLALLVGQPVLALLYEETYARADVLAWVMLAAGLGYVASFLGYAATARRIIGWQPAILAATVSASLLASLLLVPAHSLVGAGQAMTIAAGVMVAGYLSVFVLQKNPTQHHDTDTPHIS
jgi:O-antigen/teichoic acid export membrane protein